MIEFKPITSGNLYAITSLSVDETQKHFVASNTDSIMQAYIGLVAGEWVVPYGIYDGETPVGFILLSYTKEESMDMPEVTRGKYCIWRFMIDKQYQGKGYGKAAFQMAAEYLRKRAAKEGAACWLSYNRENKVAEALYQSYGFVDSGQVLEDERILVLKL